ncbi:hypothetical protein KY290_033684 [Solanum tuberosum]|uniref:RNase H type-1 domain-containing protein n=1 Tax=Solanum tuberosum TaxID=4113 RepID=A0ABQ7U2Q6_SOLTU|nr:hypothetical protein KY289_033053 [Solanum tuberosum]KAH0644678.1 hypothetical protein KY284_032562 [Solanum tuberosum]KAH0740641.1 hypothetical protein KY290_033684 [Solanum tuberosum]
MEHISREANTVADLLAVHARKTKDPNICRGLLYVFDASPSFISSALERDAMGTTSFRLVSLLHFKVVYPPAISLLPGNLHGHNSYVEPTSS